MFLFPGSAWEQRACKALPCENQEAKLGDPQIRQAEPAGSAFPGRAWERKVRRRLLGSDRRRFDRVMPFNASPRRPGWFIERAELGFAPLAPFTVATAD
jgi:hypothetical protein